MMKKRNHSLHIKNRKEKVKENLIPIKNPKIKIKIKIKGTNNRRSNVLSIKEDMTYKIVGIILTRRVHLATLDLNNNSLTREILTTIMGIKRGTGKEDPISKKYC